MRTKITARPDTDHPVDTAADCWGDDGRRTRSSRLRAPGRGRSVPHLVLGLLLVLACTGGFILILLESGQRQPVLALARAVAVGDVLTMHDLRRVDIAVDRGVAVVAADHAAAVVGRPMGTSLSAGSLLTPDAVGGAAVPTDGQAIAALALKPGQVPAEVAPGARVSVVLASSQEDTVPDPPQDGTVWPAVVTSVTTSPHDQATVVSVQLTEAAARQVAAVPTGRLTIVMLSTGDR